MIKTYYLLHIRSIYTLFDLPFPSVWFKSIPFVQINSFNESPITRYAPPIIRSRIIFLHHLPVPVLQNIMSPTTSHICNAFVNQQKFIIDFNWIAPTLDHVRVFATRYFFDRLWRSYCDAGCHTNVKAFHSSLLVPLQSPTVLRVAIWTHLSVSLENFLDNLSLKIKTTKGFKLMMGLMLNL